VKAPDWQENVKRWRQRSPTEQRRISLQMIPRKVARSMAFEGEPVDEQQLEAELQQLLEPLGLSIRPSDDQP
jgi:hypothetical protein